MPRRRKLKIDGIPTNEGLFKEACQLIDRSGIAPEVTALLSKSRDPRRRPDEYAVLVALVLNAHHSRDDHITGVTRVLNGLTKPQRARVGLHDWTYEHSYDRTQRVIADLASTCTAQVGRVKKNLVALESPVDRWMNLLLAASIPKRHPRSSSLAIDDTDKPTHARSLVTSANRQPDGEAGPSAEEAAARAAAPKSTRRYYAIDDHGRKQYTKDPDARCGWRTATSKRPGGFYDGFTAFLAAQTRDATITDPAHGVRLGPSVPQYIVTAALTEAGCERVPIGLHLVRKAIQAGWTVEDVIPDRGFTSSPKAFQLPLRSAGIRCFFDLTESQRGSKPTGGPFHLIDGWPFSLAAPSSVLGPNGLLPRAPMHAPAEIRRQYEQAFEARARYRWSTHGGPDADGARRFKGPFAASRLRSSKYPATMRLGHEIPLIHLDEDWDESADGTMTLQALELPLFQPVIFGSSAHSIAYTGRRQAVESVNSSLKYDVGRIGDPDSCRLFGRIKNTIFLMFRCAAVNYYRARAYDIELREAEQKTHAPRRRRRRRRGTFADNDVQWSSSGAASASSHDPP